MTGSGMSRGHSNVRSPRSARCREAGVRCGVRITLTQKTAANLATLSISHKTIGASRFCLYWLVPTGRGMDAYNRLQLGPDAVTDALRLLYRKAQETDAETMEFLTVDAPQDASISCPPWNGTVPRTSAMHALSSLLQKAGAVPVTGWQTSTRRETCTPASSHGPLNSLWGMSGNSRCQNSGTMQSNPVLARFRERPMTLDRRMQAVPAPGTLRRGMQGAGLCSIRRFFCGRPVLLRVGRSGQYDNVIRPEFLGAAGELFEKKIALA